MSASRPPAYKQGHRIVELDALRGIAAMSVVLFHYTTRYGSTYGHASPLPFGFSQGDSGIFLFFAISGFVIIMTLDRTRDLADFAASRASRLFPAYWTAILVTSVFVAAAGMTDLVQPPAVIAANLTMVHGFFGLPSVDGVYWTLGVELAFYAWMAAIWRFGLLPRIEPVLLAWMSLKWLWTFAPSLGVPLPHGAGALLIQQYIPFFAIGIAGYRLRTAPDRPAWPIALVVAAIVTEAVCDGPAYALVALIAAGAIGLAITGSRALRVPVLAWLGTVSYSLYLLHQNIGYAVIGGLEAAGTPPILAIAATITVALLLASAVTYGVEQPALRWLRHRYKEARRSA